MQPLHSIAPSYDVIVVGARCAGAATAMLLARQGARVLVIDRDGPGTDTMSTHALMRGAIMQLDRWGVLDQIVDAGTPAVTKTWFYYPETPLELQVKAAHGIDRLYAPRRTVLDSTLAGAARAAGADLRYGMSFRDVIRDDAGHVAGAIIEDPSGTRHAISAGLVIGADGRRSTVARRVGARTERLSRFASSCLYAYYDDIPDDGYRWYYDVGIAAGAIPTNYGQHCVFVSVPNERFVSEVRQHGFAASLQNLSAEIDETLGHQMAGARLAGKPVGFSGQHGHMRRSWGKGWALVGDAGYFKDPNTAHGITDALRDAEILACAAAEGTTAALRRYQQTRDSLSEDLFEVTDAIASFTWDIGELQDLHAALNRVTKQEQNWMADTFQARPLAA